MIASRVSVAVVIVTSILVMAGSQAAAQGTSAKGCTYHPPNGGDPVQVAEGQAYTPPQVNKGGHAVSGFPPKLLCQNGKLVKTE